MGISVQQKGKSMKNIYGIFLRGINVNGVKVPMSDLKTALEELGYEEVRTILATGNVLVTTDIEDQLVIKSHVEAKLKERFNYDAHILIRSYDELLGIVTESNKYPINDTHHKYVLLCESVEVVHELEQLFFAKLVGEKEQFFTLVNNAFWIVEKNNTLTSAFGSKVLGSKKYKSSVTSRNMNTMEKIVNL